MLIVKRELLNGPIIEKHDSENGFSTETICKIYELAEQLLQNTIGSERIETLEEDRGVVRSGINLIEIAEQLGISVYTESMSKEQYHRARDEIVKNEKRKGEIPYIAYYREEEIDYTAEIEIRKCLSSEEEYKNGARAAIRLVGHNSFKTQNFATALGIAKIYFASPRLFQQMLPPKFYVFGDWVYETKSDMIEKMFAYALVAPHVLMCKLEENYRQAKKNWPMDLMDWIETLGDTIGIPELHAGYAWKCWRQYRIAKDSKEKK